MKLGLTELMLLFFILLIIFGPTVIPRVMQWSRRAGDYQKSAVHRRAAAQAQARQMRDVLLRRFSVAATIVLGGAALCWAGYLVLAPAAYPPQKYTPVSEGIVLADQKTGVTAQQLDIMPYQNPICLVQQDGWLYAAVDGGKIIRCRPDGSGLTEVLSNGGEITSLCFAPDGTLYITDAAFSGTEGGALLKASFDGWAVSVEPVAAAINGQPLACPTAVEAAPDGKVYFADFSEVRAADHGLVAAFGTELLAHTATGAVYVYDPATGTTECVAKGIAGAGGLTLDEAGTTLYISETESGSVWRLPAETRDMPLTEAGSLVAGGLPGYPAGLSRGSNGSVWISLCGERITWLDNAAGNPLLRKIVMHLPRLTQRSLLRPKAQQAMAIALSSDGNVQRTLAFVPASGGGRITGVYGSAEGCWLASADGSVIYRASVQG